MIMENPENSANMEIETLPHSYVLRLLLVFPSTASYTMYLILEP